MLGNQQIQSPQIREINIGIALYYWHSLEGIASKEEKLGLDTNQNLNSMNFPLHYGK